MGPVGQCGQKKPNDMKGKIVEKKKKRKKRRETALGSLGGAVPHWVHIETKRMKRLGGSGGKELCVMKKPFGTRKSQPQRLHAEKGEVGHRKNRGVLAGGGGGMKKEGGISLKRSKCRGPEEVQGSGGGDKKKGGRVEKIEKRKRKQGSFMKGVKKDAGKMVYYSLIHGQTGKEKKVERGDFSHLLNNKCCGVKER